MKIEHLELHDFRLHERPVFLFKPGLTAVIGPNGSGKSTITEAMMWAIYGSAAARGTNDDLPRHGAKDCEVKLRIEIGGEALTVVRSLGAATLIGGNGNTLVTGARAVTAELEKRIGMGRDEFSATYFTAQKELEFLADKGPTDRARFLARIMGYDKLKRAQKVARERKREATARVEVLERMADDAPDAEKMEEARAAVEGAGQRVAELEAQVEKLTGLAQAAQGEVDAMAEQAVEHQKATTRLEAAEERVAEYSRRLEDARTALANAEAAAKEAAATRRTIEEEGLEEAQDRLVSLQRARDRQEHRSTLLDQREAAERERRRLAEMIAEWERAINSEAGVRRRKVEAEAALRVLEEAKAEEEELKSALAGAEARVEDCERTRIRIKEIGVGGECPTCTREMEEGHFETALDDAKQALIAAEKRRLGLKEKLDALLDPGQRLNEVKVTLDGYTDELTEIALAKEDLPDGRERMKRLDQKVADIDAKVAEIPEVDTSEIEELKPRVQRYEGLKERIRKLDQQAEMAGSHEEKVQARTVGLTDARTAMEEAKIALQELAFDEGALAAKRQEMGAYRRERDQLAEQKGRAVDRLSDLRGDLRVLESAAEKAKEAAAELERESRAVRVLKDTDRLFQDLRTWLNESLRPDLSAIATELLVEMTDGRFTRLELDEDYQIRLFEGDRALPVISGGEEDVANLAVRLAVSELLAQRSGQPINMMMLDEVFGSLDDDRQRLVLGALQRLARERFEQIILITHTSAIRELADNTISLTA